MTTTNTIVLGLSHSNSEVGWVLHFGGLFTPRVIHFARYTSPFVRVTKGDKVKHMFVSWGAIHFGGCSLRDQYTSPFVRVTKGDKVKHTCMVPIIVSWAPIHFGYSFSRRLRRLLRVQGGRKRKQLA